VVAAPGRRVLQLMWRLPSRMSGNRISAAGCAPRQVHRVRLRSAD